jgi:LPS export ABC transporter protein LptC
LNLKLIYLIAAALIFAACSFNYGSGGETDAGKPDIVMENLEYVRVRKGDPLARFQAEYAERWEERQIMELKNFSFEQFENSGDTVNAEGRAGAAVVQLGSGDISLKGGVRINVESEDFSIRTSELEWKDKERILSGGDSDEVDIQRSDGTNFYGSGFSADARNRLWSFSGEVKGTYVEKEDEKDTKKDDGIIESGTAWVEPVAEQAKVDIEPELHGLPPEPAAGQGKVDIEPELRSLPPEQFFEPKPTLPVPKEPVLPEDK